MRQHPGAIPSGFAIVSHGVEYSKLGGGKCLEKVHVLVNFGHFQVDRGHATTWRLTSFRIFAAATVQQNNQLSHCFNHE